jgi:hypothetical protein
MNAYMSRAHADLSGPNPHHPNPLTAIEVNYNPQHVVGTHDWPEDLQLIDTPGLPDAGVDDVLLPILCQTTSTSVLFCLDWAQNALGKNSVKAALRTLSDFKVQNVVFLYINEDKHKQETMLRATNAEYRKSQMKELKATLNEAVLGNELTWKTTPSIIHLVDDDSG